MIYRVIEGSWRAARVTYMDRTTGELLCESASPSFDVLRYAWENLLVAYGDAGVKHKKLFETAAPKLYDSVSLSLWWFIDSVVTSGPSVEW